MTASRRTRPNGSGRYALHRLDDNGNEFVVKRCASRSEAGALRDEFEARGHKQTYWIVVEDREP